MMLRKWLVLVTCAVMMMVLAAACATANPLPTTTPPVLATLPPLESDILVIYYKSGGIAGIDETLTIHEGGVAEWTARGENPKSLLLSEETLAPLRQMLGQKEFAELQPLYAADGDDLFSYTITARDANGNTKTVTTMDGAENPEFLGLLIVVLENMRAIVAKNG